MPRNRQLIQISRNIERVTERAVKKITLDIVANLKEVTPVDIGWARANWVPKIGSRYQGGRSKKVTETRLSTAQLRQEQGITEVATGYTLDKGTVFVSNNVPYIQVLNNGHSSQEPAGFIQRAIIKATTDDFRGFSQ